MLERKVGPATPQPGSARCRRRMCARSATGCCASWPWSCLRRWSGSHWWLLRLSPQSSRCCSPSVADANVQAVPVASRPTRRLQEAVRNPTPGERARRVQAVRKRVRPTHGHRVAGTPCLQRHSCRSARRRRHDEQGACCSAGDPDTPQSGSRAGVKRIAETRALDA